MASALESPMRILVPLFVALAPLVGCSDFQLTAVVDSTEDDDVLASDTGWVTGDPSAEGESTDGDWDGEPSSEEGDPASDSPEDAPEDSDPVDDPAPEEDCEDTSDLVYVIERDNDEIKLFDPQTLTFETLGTLDCDDWSRPGSMAVNRQGSAFVRYSDDTLYEVDLDTLACAPVPYSRPGGFGSFGMGFSTETDGTWREELYVADADTLGVLDAADWVIDAVGTLPSQSELSGTAEGELWAFLPLESPAALVSVDPDTGREQSRLGLAGFPDPSILDAFAFAAWGGEFYLFVRTYGMGNSTNVYRVDASGNLTLERERVGFDVVGAGVSTCAPTE